MKQFLIMALAAAAVVGCSKKESYIEPGDPSQKLNIVTSIASASQPESKTAVDGTQLPLNSAIGVCLAKTGSLTEDFASINKTGTAGYSYYQTASNVRFTNDAAQNLWSSVDESGATKLLLLSGSESATVYAYYPYVSDDNLAGAGNGKTVKVPLTLIGSVNARDYEGTSDANSDGMTVAVATDANEKDYMYHKSSSGDVTVSLSSTTTAKLNMNHALARIAFRVYTTNQAQNAVSGDVDSYYTLKGFTVKNKSGQTTLAVNGNNAVMNISTGTISGNTAGGQIERTVTNYKMAKQEASGDDQGTTVAGNSAKVGFLTYPLASDLNNLEVVFQIGRVANTDEEKSSSGYAIPFNTTKVTSWEAGKSYTYTVKFTGSALSIETVTVTDWTETDGGDMAIE